MRPLTRLAILSLMALLAACTAPPQAPATDPVLQPLGQGLWLLPGRFPRERQPDGNSLVLEGHRGLVLIDSGRHAEHSQALLAFAARRGRPFTHVINTHWHLDHLGGNARLRDALPGLEVIGSPAVARAVGERFPGYRRDLEGMLADPKTTAEVREMVHVDLALYDRAAALVPTRAIDGPPRALSLAGRELTIGHDAAASDGDLWILDRASGVLAVGDLVTLPVPFLDTACLARGAGAHRRAAVRAPAARPRPGDGPRHLAALACRIRRPAGLRRQRRPGARLLGTLDRGPGAAARAARTCRRARHDRALFRTAPARAGPGPLLQRRRALASASGSRSLRHRGCR